MCYNVAYLTKRKITYARRVGASDAEVQDLEQQLEELTRTQVPMFHVSGFAHPQLLCFSRDEGPRFELLRWGLVPHWAKDAAQAAQLGRQTLNARGETLFEKPAFRKAAHHRCMVLVDGFFEFHHVHGGTVPFHIRLRDGEAMALGGVRAQWTDPQGGRLDTVSIVTTEAGPLMARIHNNPKAEGPRMPVVLPRDADTIWLDRGATPEQVRALMRPFPDELLEAYAVGPLLGKAASPNAPEALEPKPYTFGDPFI
jgi:putative SOS response-associated peptidase YedK